MKTKALTTVVLAVAVASVGAYAAALSFFTNRGLYEAISSYEGILHPDNSTLLEDMRRIPEAREFLAKHVGTNRIIAVEADPVFTALHASGGYTGEPCLGHGSKSNMFQPVYLAIMRVLNVSI